MDNQGIDDIAAKLFDTQNKLAGLPAYALFVKAFEKNSGLKKPFYRAQPLDGSILFHTQEEVFVVDTYKGLEKRLKSYADRRSYVELFTETDAWIWGELSISAGIEKHNFIPVLQAEWEALWHTKFERAKTANADLPHLEELKATSYGVLQVFIECYNDSANIIELALELDEMDMYPLAVFTMLMVLDASACYAQYCELEFAQEDWDQVSLHNMDTGMQELTFFIKPYDL